MGGEEGASLAATPERSALNYLKPDNDGGLCLEIHLAGIMLEITCRPDFPITRPEIVVSVNDHKRIPFLLSLLNGYNK